MKVPLSSEEMPKVYDPSTVEERLYAFWVDKGYFTPKVDHGKKPFVIIMPPPNVTGELHLGHALTASLEDTLVRWHRMLGEPTLWLPGTDHAGIATQVVVERSLKAEGLSRESIGRDAFVRRCWEWVGTYGNIISRQLQRMGASCDWTRSQFTLDQGPSKAVATTFTNLYKKNLIYRGERIINWCPRCSTALSDLEVNHQDEHAYIYRIRYPFADGSGNVTVATTRPETLLGDTAVAVNPNDSRYAHALGRELILPILGHHIPIIVDDSVDVEFGTGALKITPGHDPKDFEIGQRHNLPRIDVISMDGTMNDNAGPYKGVDRFQCRKAIVDQLQEDGLLESSEPYQHSVGHCQRCDTIVEPLVSKQWFLRIKPLAQPAIDAVVTGKIRIVPERFGGVYLNWMENIRDWCISRQLWWGHRIPVWYCEQCDSLTVEVEQPNSCSNCSSTRIEQDQDVLDTWFSSALWTHSTLGWPNDTADLRYFYPTSVMETGYDILFFWVARMVMMGIENMGEIPFHTVFLHGLIRDEHGVKMSKTKGNVIDPLQAIQSYGTDALRLALTTSNAPGSDLRLSQSRLESSRNFANKLWNASRFVLSYLTTSSGIDGWTKQPIASHRHDRWILSRLNRVISRVNNLMSEFQIGEAQRELQDFVWGEFCDWYIELAKLRLRDDSSSQTSPLITLVHVLEKTLRLLHPFLPFITEEIWQNLSRRLPREGDTTESIMIAAYPITNETYQDTRVEEEMAQITQIIRSIRNVRAELRLSPSQELECIIEADEIHKLLEEETRTISSLARVAPVRLLHSTSARPSADEVVTIVVNKAVLLIPLKGLVDVSLERKRLEGALSESLLNEARLEKRLEDPEFQRKAPEEVTQRESLRLFSIKEGQAKLRELLSQLPQ
jgi:valyl-tRNA synthetase